MKTKKNGMLTLFFALIVQLSFAQEKTITGTVSDQDGLPLPGVNIAVQGTTNGTQTDFDGNYSINGKTGQTLLFTYIGQKDVDGVQVNTAGGFLGVAPNVIIRSKNSITGNNQPLYVIDGIPIAGDRSFDLDPNNITSTSVLKGLAASTLYGEDGRNGVILGEQHLTAKPLHTH